MSVFRDALLFFNDLGVFDVVLPFLLIFTLVFGLLEKTKVFGLEKVGDKEYTRKNLNAMVAFVIAFFVVASTRLVSLIHEFIANVVLVLIIIFLFLLLVGSFHEEKEKGFFLQGTWAKFLTVIVFISVIMIFLHSAGWLQFAWNYVINNWDSNVVATIVLFVFLAIVIVWLTSSKKEKKEEK